MIDELLKNLKEGEGNFEYDGNLVSYKIGKDGYEIKVEKLYDEDPQARELVEQFKKEIEELDDNIFTSACEIFPNLAEKSIHDFAKILEECSDMDIVNDEINLFKRSINYAIDKEITRLTQYKYYEQ